MIFAGRRLNDSMPGFIVNQIVKGFVQQDISTKNAKALILGATFKENCPDLRNSKVLDLHQELLDFGFQVDVYDPQADSQVFKAQYNKEKIANITENYDVIILAVAHSEFRQLNPNDHLHSRGIVFDVKGFYNNPNYLYL